MLRDLQKAARFIGVQLYSATVKDERDFETAFATLGQEKEGALVVPGGALSFESTEPDRHIVGAL
jgi:hypothetical protein